MHVYVYKRKRSTFVGGESGAVEVDNVVHKLVQERRVVRDAHERLLPLAQVTLEPDTGLKTAINNNNKKKNGRMIKIGGEHLLRTSRSRWLLGSSRRRRSGWEKRARAMEMRIRQPPE
jgi:hypothetical protein